MFEKGSGMKRIIIKSKVYYRGLCRYPQRTPLPCSIKGCKNKKRNGRCGLKEVHLELDDNRDLTGKCFMCEVKK